MLRPFLPQFLDRVGRTRPTFQGCATLFLTSPVKGISDGITPNKVKLHWFQISEPCLCAADFPKESRVFLHVHVNSSDLGNPRGWKAEAVPIIKPIVAHRGRTNPRELGHCEILSDLFPFGCGRTKRTSFLHRTAAAMPILMKSVPKSFPATRCACR